MPVALAMRYGNPSIENGLSRAFAARQQVSVLLVPLFPHYAMSTTESVVEETKAVLARLKPGMSAPRAAAFLRQSPLPRRAHCQRPALPVARLRSLALQLSRPAGAPPPQDRPNRQPLPASCRLLHAAPVPPIPPAIATRC